MLSEVEEDVLEHGGEITQHILYNVAWHTLSSVLLHGGNATMFFEHGHIALYNNVSVRLKVHFGQCTPIFFIANCDFIVMVSGWQV